MSIESIQPFARRRFLRGLLLAAAGLTAPSLVGCGGAGAPATSPPPTGGPATAASTGGQSAVAPATGQPSPATKPIEPVRMACWSPRFAEQTNVFAGEEFGWFKEQGLEFEFVTGAGGGDAVKRVLSGDADIAFTNPEPLFFAADQGEKLRGVWNIYPENVFNVVAPKGKGITKPQDLKGKKVGVYSMASGTRHNLLLMLRTAGLKETDVEVIAVGVANFAALIEGKIDAMAGTDTGLWAAQQQGLGEVDVMLGRDFLNWPADIFVVSEKTYQERREFVRRFLAAYKKGTRWMLDNPDKAAELSVKYATDGRDPKRNLEIIKIRNTTTENGGTKANGLGWFDFTILERVEESFRSLGLTKNKLDVKQLFTNEFVTNP